MNVTLWIIAGVLAAVYLAAGLFKLVMPYEKITANKNLGWAKDFSPGAVKAIGTAEVLGAAGLILPQATGIAEALTPWAAVGLVLVQLGAMVVHVRRGEAATMLPVNITLAVLAGIVAIGRFAGWG
ncbi:DoxX family protein [Rhodococcus sp. NPDC058514]|uniref:DoxX family protein n=1 Tax=unclassified Rhodococcus (in: high G+C Gram-positive bacteria) TaxID=192944 RepID=UPI003659D74B